MSAKILPGTFQLNLTIWRYFYGIQDDTNDGPTYCRSLNNCQWIWDIIKSLIKKSNKIYLFTTKTITGTRIIGWESQQTQNITSNIHFNITKNTIKTIENRDAIKTILKFQTSSAMEKSKEIAHEIKNNENIIIKNYIKHIIKKIVPIKNISDNIEYSISMETTDVGTIDSCIYDIENDKNNGFICFYYHTKMQYLWDYNCMNTMPTK